MAGVAFGETGFVAAGWEYTGDVSERTDDIDAAVWTSSDGESWERVVDAEGVFAGPPIQGTASGDVVDPGNRPSLQWMRAVVAGGPGFVAVGEDDSQDAQAAVWTSPDGRSWSRVPADAQAFGSRFAERHSVSLVRLFGVAAAEDGRLVAVGVDGPGTWTVGAVLLSANGVSWTRAPHDQVVFGGESSITRIEDVVAGGPGLVAVGGDGTILGVSAAIWTSP